MIYWMHMAEKQKRQINTKVALTNLFMSVSVIAIVTALTLIAMGYRLADGEITQYGLLQVVSVPSGARVEVDGNKVENTTMSRMMPDGKHTLTVTKSGYDVWRGEADIKSGLLRRVDWVRLFPIERTVEQVQEFEDIRGLVSAPTRSSLLVERAGAKWNMIENVDSGKPVVRELTVPEWLIGQEISDRRWNSTGDRLFVKIGEDWGMIDLRDIRGSMNISKAFSMKFDDISIANDAGDKLYALEGGNLRVLDLRAESISDVKVADVKRMGGDGNVVGYVQTVENGEVIGVYREGELKGKVIFRPTSGEDVSVRAWRYWGEDVVAGVFDGDLVVKSGAAYGTMEEVVAIEVGETGSLGASPSGRFLTMGGNVVDISNGMNYDVKVGHWLDDYLMYGVGEGKLTVWDYNGGNEREISEVGGNTVMIARGNGWLYFVDVEGSAVVREKL